MISPAASKRRSLHGFTLIEAIMVIVLIGILSALTISVLDTSIDEARFDATVAKLKQIRNAIVGDPAVKQGNVRSSFGFLGDIGAIPTTGQGLAALLSNPGLPAWSINTTARLGIGWNGPYLIGGEAGTDYTIDAWGNGLVYDGASVPPSILSFGSDGVAGGSGFAQDIQVTMPVETRLATVHGFISNGGAPYLLSADVELNSADGDGALTTSTASITSVDKGYFSFANVPLGQRSITVYSPSKVAATKTVGPVVITVESPNFMVPSTTLDLNLNCGSGQITYAGNKSLSGGNATLNFDLNYLANLTITKMTVQVSVAVTYSSFTTQSLTYQSAGLRTFTPNPASSLEQIVFGGTAFNVSIGSSVASNIVFSGSVAAATNTTLFIQHDQGCDTIVIP